MAHRLKNSLMRLRNFFAKAWRGFTKPIRTLYGKLTNKQRESFVGYMFISIWLIGFIALTAVPLIESLVYSFNTITIVGGEGIRLTFAGFANYIRIFGTDLTFLTLLQEFLFEMILFVPVINILAMLIAILLNRKFKFRGFFRAVFFLPVIITSGPIISELMRQGAGTLPALTESGILDLIEQSLPKFISDPLQSLFSQIIFMLWFSGVQVVLYLAGLQKLDHSMYEAAQIDGANAWESFWKITLPSLRPMILVSSIFTIVTLATFANNPIIQLISKVMFDPIKGYGYASGLAWIYFIMIALLLTLTTKLINPKEKRIREAKRYDRSKI